MIRDQTLSRPTSLTLLCALTAVSAFGGLADVLHPDGAMFLAGFVIEGASFRAYYSVICMGLLAAAWGLFALRRWGLVLFLALSAWSAFVMMLNIITVDAGVLQRAGWQDPASQVVGYRWLQALGLVLALLLCIWALRYATLLRPHANVSNREHR